MMSSKRAPNRMLFTDLGIQRLQPPKTGQMLYWDTGQKGLHILSSAGGTKSFRSMFNVNGKWKTRSIGRFGELTDDGKLINVEWAREQLAQDKKLARKGIDPRVNTRSKGPVITLETIINRFIELYAKPRQRTWVQTEQLLKKNCAAWLDKQIDQITKEHVYDLLDRFIEEEHPAKARVTLAWLKTLWRWAYKRDLVSAPIMEAVEINYEIEEQNHRVFTDNEIKAVWHAAEILDPVEGAYIKLLVLLAPRKTALAGMRYSELDDTNYPTLWTTPFERTKSRKTSKCQRVYLTPLPPLAQRILKSVPHRHNELVFPGRRDRTPLSPSGPLKRKLVAAGVPDDFAFHTIQHTVVTWLQNEGYSEYERRLILNHSGTGTVTSDCSQGYPIELKRTLLAKWADHVECVSLRVSN